MGIQVRFCKLLYGRPNWLYIVHFGDSVNIYITSLGVLGEFTPAHTHSAADFFFVVGISNYRPHVFKPDNQFLAHGKSSSVSTPEKMRWWHLRIGLIKHSLVHSPCHYYIIKAI